jgi:hypothetical protein
VYTNLDDHQTVTHEDIPTTSPYPAALWSAECPAPTCMQPLLLFRSSGVRLTPRRERHQRVVQHPQRCGRAYASRVEVRAAGDEALVAERRQQRLQPWRLDPLRLAALGDVPIQRGRARLLLRA